MSAISESNRLIRNVNSFVSSDTRQMESENYVFTVRVWIFSTLVIVLYNIVVICREPVIYQYFLHRITQDHNNFNSSLGDNTTYCDRATGLSVDIFNPAQTKASKKILLSIVIGSISSLFTCLFAGSLSDFLGRKFVLVFSLFGSVGRMTILCLVYRLDLDVRLAFFGSAIEGVVGSYFVINLAVTTIITDITPDPKNRAVRFAIIDGITAVTASLSQIAVGYLIQVTRFFVPVMVFVFLLLVSLFITICLLPETLRNKQVVTCNFRTHIKKTFSFYMSDGDKGSRSKLIIGLATYLTVVLSLVGRNYIEIMFVLNWPVCWNSVDIGIFSAAKMMAFSLAALALLSVCKNRLSLEVTGMICAASSAAGFILESFADSTLLMYLSVLVGGLYATAMPISRAIMSEIVSHNEQGALFSNLFCIEALARAVSSTIYTLIYNDTLETFRGAIFMVMAGLFFLNIMFLGTFRYLRIANHVTCKSLMTDPTVTEKYSTTNGGKS